MGSHFFPRRTAEGKGIGLQVKVSGASVSPSHLLPTFLWNCIVDTWGVSNSRLRCSELGLGFLT